MTLPPGKGWGAAWGVSGRYLLLKGAGHQPPQLGQAVVDAVAAALLDDLGQRAGSAEPSRAAGSRGRPAGTHPSAPLPGQDLRGGGGRHGTRGRAEVPAGSSGTAVTAGARGAPRRGGQGGGTAQPA